MQKGLIIIGLSITLPTTAEKHDELLMKSRNAKVKSQQLMKLISTDNNPIEVAEAFNKYFSEIGLNLPNDVENVDTNFNRFLTGTAKHSIRE